MTSGNSEPPFSAASTTPAQLRAFRQKPELGELSDVIAALATLEDETKAVLTRAAQLRARVAGPAGPEIALPAAVVELLGEWGVGEELLRFRPALSAPPAPPTHVSEEG